MIPPQTSSPPTIPLLPLPLLPLLFFAFLFLPLLPASNAYAAPKAKAIAHWAKADKTSKAQINHEDWQKFLTLYLKNSRDGIARLDYQNVSPDNQVLLKRYIEGLTQTRITSYNRNQQRAFWVNFYNALTVSLILDHYPVESITEIGGTFLSPGPWNDKIATIEAQNISLNDIEHGILRPYFRDNRLHYVLNCASYGCPNLPSKALTAENSDQIMQEAARLYIAHPRGATLKDGRLILSSIFKWYGDDFGKNDREIIAHIASHAPPAKKAILSKAQKIDGYAYGWQLNDTRFSPN